MKKTFLKVTLMTAFLSILLASCGDVGGQEPQKDEDGAIKGPLTTIETWPGKDSEGNPITYYINERYLIHEGGSLTIEEGAIVKFGEAGGMRVNSQSITAEGVIFTSWRDPRGRTIKAAGAAAPDAGDWGGIYIYNSVAKFTNCEFSYAGKTYSTVEVTSGSKARIDKCTFKNNSGTGSIKDRDSGVIAALKFGSSTTYDQQKNCVTNTSFENNVWPVSMPAGFYISNANTFSNNEYEFVYINTASIQSDTTWDYLSIPYMFSDNNNLTIHPNATLTINGGNKEGVDKSTLVTTICFVEGGIYISEKGSLKVNDYIKFTNNPKNPDNLFKGIQCVTSRKWMEGKSVDSANGVYLKSSATVTIENDNIPESKNNDRWTAEIEAINSYDVFKYNQIN